MVDSSVIANWLARVVQVPSVNPMQAGPRAGVAGEAKLATMVGEWFKQFGGEVHIDEVLPGRANVMGLWRGRTDRWAGVDVHLDTVGVEAMTEEPFSGRIAGGRVWGRGASDTKGTLGVVLALLESIYKDRRRAEASVMIAATVDEEGDAAGAPALANWLRKRKLVIDELAVAEPTLCAPVHGHRGVMRLRLRFEGVASHSALPHLGKNAVAAAARVAVAMEEENDRLQRVPVSTPLGPGHLTVTVLRGGESLDIVPPSCEMVIDRRVTAGETAVETRGRMLEIARRASPQPFKWEAIHEIDPFWQPADGAWVKQLSEWGGCRATVAPYGTNAWAHTSDVARQCVVIGPGSIDQAHTKDEWIAIDELAKFAGMVERWWGIA